MKPKEAAGDAWPDIMKGVEWAQLNLVEKAQAAKGLVNSQREVRLGKLIMIKEADCKSQYPGIPVTSISR